MNNIRALAEDPDVFEVFYREHLKDVQRFIARRVDDPHRAADLTADVFLAVIDSASSYRPDLGAPRAWLFGIARNVVRGEYRRRHREARAIRRYQGERDLEPDAMSRAIERLDAAAEARAYLARLEDLPAALRAVMELVVVDELTIPQAAAALGISPGTARVRLHRARRRLTDAPPTLNEGAPR